VLSTLFWLEHRLWGLTPAGFHIVTVLLHLDVTPLLWPLLLRLARPGAWGVAMVFAIQPRHPETAADRGTMPSFTLQNISAEPQGRLPFPLCQWLNEF